MKACLKRPSCGSLRYRNTRLTLSFDYLLPSNYVVVSDYIAGLFNFTAKMNMTYDESMSAKLLQNFFDKSKAQDVTSNKTSSVSDCLSSAFHLSVYICCHRMTTSWQDSENGTFPCKTSLLPVLEVTSSKII